jgi:TRAP-type C4-dicarboxylate transport system permease small subunit
LDTYNKSKDVTAYGTGHLDLSLSHKTPGEIVAQVIKILLAFLGVVFLILMMYGGFKWMLSGGSSEDISAAKKTIKNGFIGLLIIMAAYGITSMIGSLLSQATGR